MSPVSLITGIFGMDAQNLARLLLSKGHSVIGTYRYSATPLEERTKGKLLFQNPRLKLICTDLTDASGISRLLAEVQPDYIFNLAAMSHVGQSFIDPTATFSTDTFGLLNLLEGIRQHSLHSKIYQACHDVYTRVMTPEGPKKYADVKVGDLVFTLNPSGQIELQPIKNIYIYPKPDSLIKIVNRDTNQMVTANHRVMVANKNLTSKKLVGKTAGEFSDKHYKENINNNKQIGLEFLPSDLHLPDPNSNSFFYIEAATLKEIAPPYNPSSPSNYYLPLTVPKQGAGWGGQGGSPPEIVFADHISKQPRNITTHGIIHKMDTADFLYVLGLLIGNNYSADKSCSYILTSPKHATFERITRVLDRNQITWTQDGPYIKIKCFYLKELSAAKRLPGFVFHYSGDLLGNLWDGLVDSDPLNINFITRDFVLAAQAVVVGRCIGKNASITKYDTLELETLGNPGKKSPPFNPFKYIVVVNKPQPLERHHIQEFTGKGKNVWCLEVENANFMICRHGKLSFSGNSTSEMFGKNFDKDKEGLPIQTINTPFKPSSPYGIAKLASHHLIRVYREGYNIFAVSGILFNHTDKHRTPTFFERKVSIYGGKLAHWLNENPHFSIDERVLRGKTEFPKLPLGVIEGVYRDIGWSPDYMAAALLMLEQDHPQDYVVAMGESYPITRILELAIGKNYKDFVYEDPQLVRPVDVPYLKGDSTPIKELGWSPTKTFDEIINLLINNDRK